MGYKATKIWIVGEKEGNIPGIWAIYGICARKYAAEEYLKSALKVYPNAYIIEMPVH